MIFRYFLTIALALASSVDAAPPKPRPADDSFLKAYDAYRAGDPMRLAKLSAGLEEHVLAPYLEFWILRLRLDSLSRSEARDFLSRRAGSYLADRLRSPWLQALRRRADGPAL